MRKKINEIVPYIVIIIVVVLIRSYIITPVEVIGNSMQNTLFDGEILLLEKLSYRFKDIARFDIVVIIKDNDKIIKRVIGLPGETVSYNNDELYINGKLVGSKYAKNETGDFTMDNICNCNKIPEDKYLVLGDNREVSKDSRIIGLIDKSEIQGKTILRIWPFTKFGTFK